MNLHYKSLLAVLSISIVTLGQGKTGNHEFAIVIGSCFNQDTLTIKIDGRTAIENAVATSDFATGTTGVSIYQDKEGLFAYLGSNKIELEKIVISKLISIELTINGITRSAQLNLKKGKNILIDKCKVSVGHGTPPQVVTFRQFKKGMVFE